MKPLLCSTCHTANPSTESLCSRCGGSLTEARLKQKIEELQVAGAHVKDAHRPTPRLHAINGCGTTLLDYRPQEEGTYLATRWFTLFYLPILPLSAMRVRPIQREGQFGRETYRVEILSLAQLDPMRVLRTYLLTLLAVGPALFAFCRMDSINRWFGSGPGFVVNLATLIWFGFLLYKISNSDHLFRRKSA